MSSLNHFTKNQFSYNRYKTQYTTNFKILNQPLEDSSRIYVVSTDLVVLVQTGSLLLSGLSHWSGEGFLSLSGSTGHLIYVVSNVRALRACLDPNGSAYQVDLPMTSEPFPRRIGLFESLSFPVDWLLITIGMYTHTLRLPAIHFLLRCGSRRKATYATSSNVCVYRCNDLIGRYADRGRTCTNLYKKAM